MIDRHKLETVLRRRFPEATWNEIAAAANAIMGLGEEWEEVPGIDPGRFDEELRHGCEFRVFRRAEGTLRELRK